MMNETIVATHGLVVRAAAAEGLGGGSSVLDLTAAHVAVVQTRRNQRGMVSAEWAVGILAAIAIAGVLLAVVTSAQVEKALLAFITHVISTFGK
jgi:Protein of unknown function (DUF4244)